MLKDAYLFAHAHVTENGFAREIEWQNSVSLEYLSEESFLQEYAWVVLASGMREAVVRSKFREVSACFYDWKSAKRISNNADSCVRAALRVFRHEQKMRALTSTARLIEGQGFCSFKEKLEMEPMKTLRGLSYIGPVTQYHLAKNLGIDVAKPDRHLVRIAHLFGYSSVQDFCRVVGNETDSKVAVVDLVFWRFATLQKAYLEVLGQFV